MMIYEKTQIGKLSARVVTFSGGRGGASNAVASRLNLSSLLSNVTFKPTSMSPSAILIVSKLTDPLPGKLNVHAHSLLPDKQWQRAVVNQFDKIYRHAEKPQQGHLPSGADAVLFADKAELLACYVHDVINYKTSLRWWWKRLNILQAGSERSLSQRSGSENVSATLLNLFMQNIEYLPAVFLNIHLWGGQSVIQSLNKTDVLALCLQLAEKFSLSSLYDVLRNVSNLSEYRHQFIKNNEGVQSISKHNNVSGDFDRTDKTGMYELRSYPSGDIPRKLQDFFRKHMVADIKPQGLTVEHILLSGLCLVLNQQPWQAMSPVFQKRLLTIVLDSDDSYLQKMNDNTHKYPQKAPDEPDGSDASGIKINTAVKSESAELFLMENNGYEIGKENKDISGLFGNNTSSVTVDDEALNAPEDESNYDRYHGRDYDNEHVMNDDVSRKEHKSQFSEMSVVTDLAGVFYLLNLVNFLNIPSCFVSSYNQFFSADTESENLFQSVAENPAVKSLDFQLSPWFFLEIITRSILHKTIAEFHNDAIWSLLKELNAGGEFDITETPLSENYILPMHWFNSVCNPRETYRWTVKKNRLYVWAAAGYMLVDSCFKGKAAYAQADEVLRQYLGNDHSAQLVKSGNYKLPIDRCDYSMAPFNSLNSSLTRLINYVMPFIRYQLMRASGLSEKDLSTELFQCHGLVHLTSNHIDVVIPLENISIAARRAGLDRDPGWLPAVGRVVAFHFE